MIFGVAGIHDPAKIDLLARDVIPALHALP